MDILKLCAKLCEHSVLPTAVYDKDMKLIYNMTDLPPELLTKLSYRPLGYRDIDLPPRSEAVMLHDSGIPAEIVPVFDGEELCGCIARLVTRKHLADLFFHSSDSEAFRIISEDARSTVTELFSKGDELLRSHGREELTGPLSEIAETLLCRMLASLVNTSELEHYFSGEPDFESCDISTRINMTLDWAEELLSKNGCKLHRDIGEAICSDVSFPRLDAVMLNLIVNSYMYSNAGKKEISVKLCDIRGDLYLSVSDNGTAADPERLRAAAEGALCRRENSREGLGLMIARLFAERYDGDLSFRLDGEGHLTTEVSMLRGRTKPPIEFHMRPEERLFPPCCKQQCILAKGLEIII